MKNLFLVLGLFVFSTSASAANLVLNGGFETPDRGNGWDVYYTGHAGLEWTTGSTGVEI